MEQTTLASVIEKTKEAYDDIWYVGYPFQQTHPDRLAMLASLFGMQPAPVEKCRVLELGCGDGTNLIAMAYGLPESQFVGIDLAPKPLEYGKTLAAELGLNNLELRAGDIMEVDESWGKFDYLIAHGFYSWVPDFVREQLMLLCQRLLAPQGIAYISYNAYPGNRVHQMMREMMLFHTRGMSDPNETVNQGIGLLQFLADRFQSDEQNEDAVYPALLKRELKRLLEYKPGQIYHDDFSPLNTSFYFYQFMEHADRHGMQYLAEADFFEMQDFIYPPQIREFLSQFDDEQIVLKEQYMDFLKCRQFRQTLLCRKDVKLSRTINPQQLTAFYLSSPARPNSARPDLNPEVVEEFRGAKKSILSTDYPLAKAALLYLGEIYPRSVSFEQLAQVSRRILLNYGVNQTEGADFNDEAKTLAQIIYAACSSGLVEMHAYAPPFVTEVSERPRASLLAQLQAKRGAVVSTLVHKNVEMEDPIGQKLLQLLDGTRDRVALAEELVAFVLSDGSLKKPDGTTPEENEIRQIVEGALETNLQKLARMALLEA
jgi:methyltransferase-like protein/ubiquinone/menaquinone biosynthesis C-methylase UbiE